MRYLSPLARIQASIPESDSQMSFVLDEVSDVLAIDGISWETSPPYSPQSIGVAERVQCTVVGGLVSLLSKAPAQAP